MTFNSLFKQLVNRIGPTYGVSLTDFKCLLRCLNNPQQHYKIIHVAGTNGKGSVCYLTAQILQEAGYKTGLFISPHLYSPLERIQINGRPISKRSFSRMTQQVLSVENKKLNFFEILTAVALVYFAQEQVDYVVLETGLGGRQDPTNVVLPLVSVISSIGLDHCAILGTSLPQIAYEKAGIIKPQVPIFCPALAPKALSVISREAHRKKAPLTVVKSQDPFTLKRICWKQNRMILQQNNHTCSLALLGEKQVQNACLVYRLARYLGIAPVIIKRGFSRVKISGRFEVCNNQKQTIIFDGGHNPQAIKNLMRFLQQSPWNKSIAVVCAFMQDKDYIAMLKLMLPHTQQFYFTTTHHVRSVAPAQLATVIAPDKLGGIYNQPRQALRAALKKHKAVLITGSFYLIGKLRPFYPQTGSDI